MLTMTTLPPDSFHQGPHDSSAHLRFPAISSEVSSSVISPLVLPRGATGYFDHLSATNYPANGLAAHSRQARAGHVYSPLSPAAVPQFLSPHLTPISREVQQHLLQHQPRSVSLSPTRRMASTGAHRAWSAALPPSSGLPDSSAFAETGFMPGSALPPLSSMSSGHPRSASADAAGAPSQAQMIRRLVQQNGRIREAWEAERKYMEANRERAEEVYKEERALMEEERAEWEGEKAELVGQIERLEHQLLALGGDARMTRETRIASVNGVAVPVPNVRSGNSGGIVAREQRNRVSSESAFLPHATGGPVQRAGLTGAGGDASRGPGSVTVAAFQLPPLQTDLLGPIQERVTPPRQNDSSPSLPFPSSIPLPSSSTESMASLDLEPAGPVPILDIQEIHPELEGIPIKAPAVQKPTFRDDRSPSGSKSSSHTSSPATSAAETSQPKRQGKEQTLQLLAADESDRLTMHAGHTPNHSLSLLPTATISQVTTASSSGESTPTLQPGEDGAGLSGAQDASHRSIPTVAVEPVELDATNQLVEIAGHPEPVLEPVDDVELKGPLMVRNMPAHDEIFFQRLSDKLEEVSKGDEAALPAVLKDNARLSEQSEPKQPENNGQPTGAVGEADAPAPSGGSNKGSSRGSPREKGSDDEELDIPLKLKRSNNFGAPLGEFR